MTTLPQGTTAMMPRPTGNQIMIPGAVAQGVMVPQSATQMTGADVWRVIRSNLWLIIISVLVFGAAGFGVNMYLAKHFPRYTALGFVGVDVVPLGKLVNPELATDVTNPVAIELNQRTHAQLLKQEALFSEALKNEYIRQTAWFQQFDNDIEKAKKDLEDNFTVSPIPDTRLIRVSMTASDNKSTKTIVDEIVQIHLTNQQTLARTRQNERLTQLNLQRNVLRQQQADVRARITRAATTLSMDGMGVPGRVSAKEQEQMTVVNRKTEAKTELYQAESMLQSVKESVANDQTPPSVEYAVRMDPSLINMQNRIDMFDAEIASMMGRLGPDNPQIKYMQTQKESWQRKLDDQRALLTAQTKLQMIQQAETQVSMAREALRQLEERDLELKREIAELNQAMNDYGVFKRQEEDLQEEVRNIEKQIDMIERVKNDQELSGVTWMTRPEVPERMSFPKLQITLPLAIMLGLGFSLGIAFLREITDTSVRSPRDIAKVGQLSLLGMLPHSDDDPQAAGSRLPLVIFDAPYSMTAEQFRQVRTRLQHAASLDSTRSLLVTSPSPGDGKSMVACNLAAGLALNGRRILLVDANFRRPELHKTFGVPNETGFGDVLASAGKFELALVETQVPNLTLMTSGNKPANATELLESQLLTDFVERALEDYDHVIFDSGPLLFVSEAVALAPRVDGVVSVVRARTNTRGVLQRMRDTLRQVKAEHLGVILNGVRAQAGGYYNRNIKTYYAYQNGHAQ